MVTLRRVSMHLGLACLLTAFLGAGTQEAPAKKSRIEITQFEGRAYDLKSGRLVYIEDHREYRRKGRHFRSLVYYRYPNRRVFAVKRVTYRGNKPTPDFTMTDYRTGYVESARRSSGSFLLATRDRKGAKLRTKRVRMSGYAVIDEGFDYAVRQLWSKISRGPQVVSFAVPGRLDYYRFRIASVGFVNHRGQRARRLRFSINNRILRLLAPDIYLLYDSKSRRLLQYRGLSNIPGPGGKNYFVRVEFNPAAAKKSYN